MRRALLFVLVFFAAPILVAGCGSGGNSDSATSEWKELTGVIKPLGVSIYQEGTHRLEKNNALVAILESSRLNLLQYEEAEVQVAGEVRSVKQGPQQIMDVRELAVITEADSRIKRTHTYVSPYYSYRFEYMPSWSEYTESKESVLFEYEEKDYPVFTLQTIKTDESFASWLKSISFKGFAFDVETLIRVDGKNATRRIYRSGDDQIISVSLPLEKFIYHFLFDSRGALDAQEDKSNFYDLIDSFSFSPLVGENATSSTVSKEEDKKKDENSVVGNEKEPAAVEVVDENKKESEKVAAGTNITSDEVQSALEKGFTRFTSSSLKFSIDIPKSWYYSGFSGVTGAIYRYGFTDYKTYQESGDDINLGNLIAMLDIVSGGLDEVKKGSLTQIGSHKVYVASSSDQIQMYFRRDDSTTFVMKGNKALESILSKMVESIRAE